MTYPASIGIRVPLFAGIALAVACGPAVVPQGEDADASSSSGSPGTTPPGMSAGPETSPATSSDPTTPVTTSPATTGVPPLPETSGGFDSSGDGEDPGNCNFLCPDDTYPETFECDILMQDCPRGEKCSPWANDGGSAWNATKCVPVDADADGVGEPCTVEGNAVSGIDSCDATSMCFGVDSETNIGRCYAFCQGDWEELTCPPQSECSVSGDGTLTICIPQCDPTLLDACDDGQVCVPWHAGFACQPAAPDQGGLFDACEYTNACEPGLLCGDAEFVEGCDEVGCCTPFCDLDAPVCPEGLACVGIYEDGSAPSGLEHVGVCTSG